MTKLLITGSTGYVGSRLIQALAESSYSLLCTARNPGFIQDRLPKNAVAVKADFSKSEGLSTVFEGCETAFFLMHSLGEGQQFEEMEANVARNFSEAAVAEGVQKIIYLGGLMDDSKLEHSAHMRSRKKVGDLLRASGIPVLEFRASVIIGPGSTSFELIRALVERLPVMVTPKWVRVKAQPIFIQDVIAYLKAAIEQPCSAFNIIEIGGADVVSYQSIMEVYAKVRGLRRFMIPVPFLTPYLSSLWLGLVTPVYARVGRKLIDSITSESVVTSPAEMRDFGIKPMGCEAAIRASLELESSELLVSKWSTALSSSVLDASEHTHRYGNRIVEVYQKTVLESIQDPFKPVQEIGGQNGWYFWNFLWTLRGFIDLLAGGIGLRRGRQHPTELHEGDVLDWWRVERFEPGKRLLLYAEMKLPGRAWLEFSVVTESGQRILKQTVIYDPLGILGLLYWYSIYPLHKVLFRGMLSAILRRAR